MIKNGYFCTTLSKNVNDAISELRNKAYKNYKYSLKYFKDKIEGNLFRTLELKNIDNHLIEIIDVEVKSYSSFLFFNFPSKLTLQMSKNQKPEQVKMKDLFEFHVDAIYPTFKIFIFLNSCDDRFLPYEFMPRSVFDQKEMDEFYLYACNAKKFFYKNDSKNPNFKEPCGIGQLTWNFSKSYLEEYQNLTGKTCKVLDKKELFLNSISFTSKAPILVITDNSLFHRKSWQENSKIREVFHYLPYERKSLKDWMEK